MKNSLNSSLLTLHLLLVLSIGFSASAQSPIPSTKIWSSAPHNAFTDLVHHDGYFYCVFREGENHVPKDKSQNGRVRVLKSRKGREWESIDLLASEKYDLRDPKISVMPDGRLMIIMGGSDYVDKDLLGRVCQVSFSEEGECFSEPQPIIIDPSVKSSSDWLWRVSWYEGVGYGVVYQPFEDKEWKTILVKTIDGVKYQKVSDLGLDGKPNESTVRFYGSQMYIMVRREAKGANGLLGVADLPYQNWEWKDLGMRLGGPNFVVLPDGHLVFGTRKYLSPEEGSGYQTVIQLGDDANDPVFEYRLPSGGDTSYPGMVIHKNHLWVSYYSSHEGKTSIYLSKILLK